MKRLLTYGLLLLTILASHFVVSACQDDLPETTEVMMTFTTRAVTQGAASTAPDKERMKDLHVIMLRSDGTIVGNHTEPNITASSVTFTFSTPIKTAGEDFTFLAIANENNIGKTLVNGNLEIGDKLSTGDIEELTMNASLNTIGALPQTKLWMVHVPQTQNHKVNQQLDFVASKISVQFVNETSEEQSLSDIKLTGMPQATAGYLFKQDDSDYVGTQHDASDITFNAVSNLAVSATSDAQTYYTYPVATISEAALVATWNGKPYELPLDGITSLARNEHLQIVVTLTPAQDITVNYTIAPWEENATNIGGEAPTTPGNGYHVDDWGTGGIIDVGGGGGNIWDLGDGTKIEGEEVSGATLVDIQIGGRWDLKDHLKPATNYIQEGYTLVIYFSPHFYWDGAPEEGNVSIQFKTGWDSDIGDENKAYPRVRGAKYVKYITFEGTMNGIKIDGENGLQTQNLSVHITSDVQSGAAIYIEKFAIIKPD